MSKERSTFKTKAGGNPETTMGRFQAYVNEAEGFQRKARFYVKFGLPNGVTCLLQGFSDTGR
jgi:hypothetical protein